MKRAIGYTRVSTQGQADEGISLHAQAEKIRQWCSFHGYALSQIFQDTVSGKSAENRKGLRAALATVRRGEVLVVFSLSRLSRSLHDLLNITALLDKKKVDLSSLTEKIDTTSAYGRAFFQISGVFAELERNLIADRTRAALSYKRAQGQKTGGRHTEYGRDVDPASGLLVDNQAEQQIIQKIRALRTKGYTLQNICNFLEEKGFLTKTGRKIWNPKTVACILKRTAS